MTMPAVARDRRVLLSLIALIALAVRLYRIGTLFPVMVDEAIYLRWAEIVWHQQQWFVSLLDGKQPLVSWLYAPLLLLDDPFVAARVLSAFAGVGATLIIDRIGTVLGGRTAGLCAAAMYAVAPYSVFDSHLAYNEVILDLLAAIAVWSALKPPSWRSAAVTGFWLAVGFLCKSTFLPFFAFPLLLCVLRGRERWRFLLPTYGVAAIAPIVLYFSVPAAPMPEVNFLVHKVGYFIDRQRLADDPLAGVAFNAPLIYEYLKVYLTLPVMLAAVAALFWLAKMRQAVPAAMMLFTIVILSIECVVLDYLPSRYLFPYLWPLFVGVACAIVSMKTRWLAGAAAVMFGVLSFRSGAIVVAPERHLHASDVAHFIKANRFTGYRVGDAAQFIRNVARNEGPLVLLTDPVWGVPADAMFVYLHGRDGITVHEASWTGPLLPPGAVPLVKSHYERVFAGTIDFARERSVLYVTTISSETVRKRQPDATRIATFPVPGVAWSLDVYRLK